MAADLQKLGPKSLAKKLEAAFKAEDKAVNAIYALALHGNERFSEICNRLGPDHKACIAHAVKSDASRQIELECRRRYGPAVTYRSMWPTLLRTINFR